MYFPNKNKVISNSPKNITKITVIFLYVLFSIASSILFGLSIGLKTIRLTDAITVAIANFQSHCIRIENGRQKPSLDVFIQICTLLNVTPDYLLLDSMHAYNIPQDIIDKLRLCDQSDIELAEDFIELLVKRNNKT